MPRIDSELKVASKTRDASFTADELIDALGQNVTQPDLDAETAARIAGDAQAVGGVLAGHLPTPSFAVDMATQAELDAIASATEIFVTAGSSYADRTSTIVAAVTTATDTGMTGNLNGKARSVRLASGEYGISGPVIAAPSFVDFNGSGLGNTVLKCLTRNAQVFLGNAAQLTLGAGITLPQATIAMSGAIPTGTTLQAPTAGVAFIDGIAVIYTGISGANLTGCSLLYTDDTGLTISAGATVVIPTTQGSRGGYVGNFTVDGNSISHYPCPVLKLVERAVDQILIESALRDGGMILGAQNCRISRYGGQNSVKCNLRLDASPGNNVGVCYEFSAAGEWQIRFRNDIPTLSSFTGPKANTLIVPQQERQATGLTAIGGVDHDAGDNNTLICPTIVNPNATAIAISMSKSTSAISGGLEIWGARLQGVGSTAFKLRGATTLYLNGVTDINGPALGFDCDDTTRVFVNGDIRWNSTVTTRFTTTGTKIERDIIRMVTSVPLTFSSDGIALPDTMIYRSAAGQLTTPGDLIVGGTISAGGGAYATGTGVPILTASVQIATPLTTGQTMQTALVPTFYQVEPVGWASMSLQNLQTRIRTLSAAQTVGLAVYSIAYTGVGTFTATRVAYISTAIDASSTGIKARAVVSAPVTLDFTTNLYVVGLVASDTTLQVPASTTFPPGLGAFKWTAAALANTVTWPASFTETSVGAMTAAAAERLGYVALVTPAGVNVL